jgi:hypothetical protein
MCRGRQTLDCAGLAIYSLALLELLVPGGRVWLGPENRARGRR